MGFYVYVVYNTNCKKFYIGQTEDIERRINEHNNHLKQNSFTSRYAGDWVLIYKELCSTRKLAVKREKQLKSFRGRTFIKQYIPL